MENKPSWKEEGNDDDVDDDDDGKTKTAETNIAIVWNFMTIATKAIASGDEIFYSYNLIN